MTAAVVTVIVSDGSQLVTEVNAVTLEAKAPAVAEHEPVPEKEGEPVRVKLAWVNLSLADAPRAVARVKTNW